MSTEESQTRSRQPNFSRLLRQSKETYDLVRKLVQHLATSTDQDFETMWGHVTDRDEAHFKRHFRRQRKKNDPFTGIKNAVPAYSFFTQEWNSKIAAENPDKSFGEKSKLVGQKWKSLTDKEKAKYEKLAAKDKKRYQAEIEQRSQEITTNAATAATEQSTQDDVVQVEAAPVEAEPVEAEPVEVVPSKPSGRKSGRSTRRK